MEEKFNFEKDCPWFVNSLGDDNPVKIKKFLMKEESPINL